MADATIMLVWSADVLLTLEAGRRAALSENPAWGSSGRRAEVLARLELRQHHRNAAATRWTVIQLACLQLPRPSTTTHTP